MCSSVLRYIALYLHKIYRIPYRWVCVCFFSFLRIFFLASSSLRIFFLPFFVCYREGYAIHVTHYILILYIDTNTMRPSLKNAKGAFFVNRRSIYKNFHIGMRFSAPAGENQQNREWQGDESWIYQFSSPLSSKEGAGCNLRMWIIPETSDDSLSSTDMPCGWLATKYFPSSRRSRIRCASIGKLLALMKAIRSWHGHGECSLKKKQNRQLHFF